MRAKPRTKIVRGPARLPAFGQGVPPFARCNRAGSSEAAVATARPLSVIGARFDFVSCRHGRESAGKTSGCDSDGAQWLQRDW